MGGAFRGVVGGLGEEQRRFMEGVIRAGSRTRAAGREEGGERPAIALKMDFGGA